jgi:hypothetical protein
MIFEKRERDATAKDIAAVKKYACCTKAKKED